MCRRATSLLRASEAKNGEAHQFNKFQTILWLAVALGFQAILWIAVALCRWVTSLLRASEAARRRRLEAENGRARLLRLMCRRFYNSSALQVVFCSVM